MKSERTHNPSIDVLHYRKFYNHYAACSLCRIEMLTIENTSTDSFDVSEHMKVIALAKC